MPKPPKAAHTGEAKRRGQHTAGRLRLYEILHNLNQGFERALGQLQQLEKLGLGREPWNALSVIVEENRAEINFELVERLAEHEEELARHLWPASPRAGEEASRSASCTDRGRLARLVQ